MEPSEVRDALTTWFKDNHFEEIVLRDSEHPRNDPNESYEVSYEAVFEPRTLDQARLEVWVSTDGSIGIGYETRSRIAERLGVKNRRSGFVSGYEPTSVGLPALVKNLEVIASGDVGVQAVTLPWFGLGSTEAVIAGETYALLRSEDKSAFSWIQRETRRRSRIVRMLKYRNWR